MANVTDTSIILESEVFTESELEEKRQKVKKWQDFGYSKMAILHFLSEEVKSVTTSLKEDKYVVVLG